MVFQGRKEQEIACAGQYFSDHHIRVQHGIARDGIEIPRDFTGRKKHGTPRDGIVPDANSTVPHGTGLMYRGIDISRDRCIAGLIYHGIDVSRD